jgi:hypothetical protein
MSALRSRSAFMGNAEIVNPQSTCIETEWMHSVATVHGHGGRSCHA